jgi:hypothetical protein
VEPGDGFTVIQFHKPAGLEPNVERRTLSLQMGDNGFIAEAPVKDQLGPKAQAIAQILQRIQAMAGEGALTALLTPGTSQLIRSGTTVATTTGGDVVCIGGIHHTGNGSAVPSLDSTDKSGQTVQVRVVDVDVTGRLHQAKTVKDSPELPSQPVISQETEHLATGSIVICDHRASIATCALEWAEAKSLQPEAKLGKPLLWHCWHEFVLNERMNILYNVW